MESVQKQLEELGLSQNEVKVYMAALEVGAATAQQLAAKAAVVRPTAYVAIGGLVKRGLISSHTRGKKQYFQAERPAQLLRLIDEEKKKLTERESKLKSLLPGLESLIAIAGEKPEVKYYEGLEGLEAMRKTIFDEKVKHIDTISDFDDLESILRHEDWQQYGKILNKKKITGRSLFVKKTDPLPSSKKTGGLWEYRRLPTRMFSFHGEMSIFGNNVSFISLGEEAVGIVIKGKGISTIAKVLFDLAWHEAERYRK